MSFPCNFLAYFKFHSDWRRVIGKIKQNEQDCRDTAPLSSNVFERRTSTGSEPFSLLIYLNATKFVLLSVFTLIETICPKICSNSRPKSAKSPFPVEVRRSKTSLLKLPISTADNNYFCAPREGENNKKRIPPPFSLLPQLLSSSWLYGSVHVIFGGSSQLKIMLAFKVARREFLGSIPPKFEHLLRGHYQRDLEKIITAVLYKNENLLSIFYRCRIYHRNVMTPLRLTLCFVFLGTGSFFGNRLRELVPLIGSCWLVCTSYWFCGLLLNFKYTNWQLNFFEKLTLDFLTFDSNNRIKRTYKNDVKFWS